MNKAKKTYPKANPPAVSDEQSIGGSTTDLEADDDTLANAQDVGQQLDEDEKHPQEIDIARDINKSEEDIRTH